MFAVNGSRLIPAMLREYGTMTRTALFRFLPRGEPRRYLYDLVADYPQRGGKMMRSSLCIATTRAFGGSVDQALSSAVALELLHNGMLVHDDIQDGSEERRGRPTLHTLFGVPLALNAGDMLTLLSFRPLLDNAYTLGLGLALDILEETDRMARESAEGQALELGWCRDNVTDLDESDYYILVLKKTCWLATIHPMRVGALIATRDRSLLDRFIRFGFLLGTAFQIQDDLLNLVGDHKRYGKELGGDLWEGKRTLMLIRLLSHATADERARIVAILALTRERRTAEQVAWLMDRMRAYECIEYGRRIAHALVGAAVHECDMIVRGLPDSPDKQFLQAMPRWVLERTRLA